MTWTRLSDDFTERPQMLNASRSARLLHIEAMVWCNRLETDGDLPAYAVRRLTDAENWAELIEELVTAGLWVPGASGGWSIDWSDQEPAADVRARREARAETQKRYRHRKARHARGDHSMCDPRHCKAVTSNATDNADGNDDGLVTPSRPVPSRPLGRDRGETAQPGAAGAPGRPSRGNVATLAKCQHGITSGRTIKGGGPAASRVCGDCEAADPASPPQEQAS